MARSVAKDDGDGEERALDFEMLMSEDVAKDDGDGEERALDFEVLISEDEVRAVHRRSMAASRAYYLLS